VALVVGVVRVDIPEVTTHGLGVLSTSSTSTFSTFDFDPSTVDFKSTFFWRENVMVH